MIRLIVLFFFFFTTSIASANYVIIDESVTINWTKHHNAYQPTFDRNIETPNFDDAIFDNTILFIPSYARHFDVTGPGQINVQVNNMIYEKIEQVNVNFQLLTEELNIKKSTAKSRDKHTGFVKFHPIIKTATGEFKKLVHFDLLITFIEKKESNPITFRGAPFKTISALSSGRWFKVATNQANVYKISADYFTTNLNVNANSINPNNVKIYGNGGGTIPQLNSAERTDDIEEIPIQFNGDDDNILEAGEYFLFFAESPDDISFDTSNRFNSDKNHYSFTNHYFINIDGVPGLRIQNTDVTDPPTRSSDQYYDVQRYEAELFNQLDFRQDAHGSGKRWFGDKFVTNLSKDFSSQFQLDNYVVGTEVTWYAELMTVSFDGTSRFKLNIGNDSDESTYGTVRSNTAHTGRTGIINSRSGTFNTASSNLSGVSLEFSPSSSESTGFLDYIQIQGYKNLVFKNSDNSRFYRDILNNPNEITQYSLQTDNQNINIWDIANKRQIKNIAFSNNPGGARFSLTGQLVNEFIAFDPDQVRNTPEALGEIENQNLHGISKADMLVIYHPDFKSVAERFISHRESIDGFTCASADINQVYNEFAGGSVDATGLRDMCKMIYDRDNAFKYLLLIGDGTFDMRHIKEDVEDQNFICTYQTTESDVSIKSYPADDYFGLLDDDEGLDLTGGLEISIGRFPIQKEQEGHNMLDKIIMYESDPNINGDWKQRIMIIGDDEDDNLHYRQTEELGNIITSRYKDIELTKVHFDAYEQEANSAGNRYPEVNESINNNYTKGQLVINYIGHGGNKGLAQERVVTIPQILTWDRKNGFPILVTATCSFSSFDDPDFVSGGELSILKANGGAVALMSTVRLVFAQQNFTLVKELFETLLEPNDDGSLRRLGDVYMDAKNSLRNTTLENARKFELFGDPSMPVALPRFDVYTSKINDQDISSFTDTIGALQRVKVEGFIGENNVIKSDFNGELFIKVFDKPITLRTRGQDERSDVASFEVQNTALYQGRVSVTNGQFNYEFIVPRDINYVFGEGKIIHYAKTDKGEDASGFLDGIIIGGTAKNPIVDNQPPTVELFLDDESFVSGNSVSSSPVLLVNLADDFGINISGTSIGHDISSVIDADTRSTKVLNEFYVAALDQPAQGRVEYQLKDIDPGLHTIKVQAWDIANNKGEASIEFVVIDKDDFTLDRIFNYPNPFTTNTRFQFEHDLPSSALDVQIDIYTIAGNRVKTIQESVVSEGNLVRNIAWDGLDEFGDDLARGVYLYKINVRSDNNGTSTSFVGESDFERLVILK